MRSNVPRAVRFLRHRKAWRQGDLGDRIGASRELISRLERGQLPGLTIGSVEQIAGALGATIHLELRWRGEQLDRLMDAAHASMQNAASTFLGDAGWLTAVEVSFNHYGDRGRVDLLAFHPRSAVLLVVEIKTAFGDLQETIGRLDIKTRLGRQLARLVEWAEPASVVPVLVVADTRATRRTVAEHRALFRRFQLVGRSALAWVRHPAEPTPHGLLWFANRPDSRHVTAVRRARAVDRPGAHPT